MDKILYHWKKKDQEKLISQGYKLCENKYGRAKVLCLNCEC